MKESAIDALARVDERHWYYLAPQLSRQVIEATLRAEGADPGL